MPYTLLESSGSRTLSSFLHSQLLCAGRRASRHSKRTWRSMCHIQVCPGCYFRLLTEGLVNPLCLFLPALLQIVLYNQQQIL